METTSSQDNGVLTILLRRVEQANTILAKENIKLGQLKMWNGSTLSNLKKIYGPDHEIIKSLHPDLIPSDINVRDELTKRARLLEKFILEAERIGINTFLERDIQPRIFIGHGQSPIWRELKDFLKDRLSLPWDEFNREAVAGISTFERIAVMLDSASFAFLLMTAEDQHLDETTHARQNVVHEVGLFQGKLGPKKAIILLEKGCEEFTNIVGLSQIRFPKGNISSAFEDIRRVLEREGIIKT